MLKRLYRRKLKNRALPALLDSIVDHPLPGSVTGKGVPIGNSTIQYRANLYLGELDHLIKDESRLREALAAITEVLEMRLRLELRTERTQLLPVTQGRSRRGFRVLPGVLRLDGKDRARMRRRVRGREAEFVQGLLGAEELARSARSMVAHVSHIDSLQARQRLFAAKQVLTASTPQTAGSGLSAARRCGRMRPSASAARSRCGNQRPRRSQVRAWLLYATLIR